MATEIKEWIPQRTSQITSQRISQIGQSLQTRNSETSDSEPSSTSIKRTASLSKQIADPSLLRGTSLVALLSRCGAHFKGRNLALQEYTLEESQRLFSMSRQVTRLSRFVSHCWADGRIPKFLSLLVAENLFAAVLISMFVATFLAVVQLAGWLPSVHVRLQEDKHLVGYFPYCLLGGGATMFTALFFWHHFPVLLGQGRTYFFDKICINQGDTTMKQAGIKSFAAFVAHSDKVIMLWSPRLFTRLWCVMEMAALAHVHDGEDLPLVFLPMPLTSVAFSAYAIMVATLSVYIGNHLLGRLIPGVEIIMLVASTCLFFLGRRMRSYACDRKALSDQLANFKVEEAQCALEADREVVSATIIEWFGSLDSFNYHVQTTLRRRVVSAIGSECHFPMMYQTPFLMLALFYEMDWLPYYMNDTTSDVIILLELLFLSVLPTILPVTIRVGHFFRRHQASQYKEVTMTVAAGLLNAFYFVFFFGTIFILLPMCPKYVVILSLPISWVWALWLNWSAFKGASRTMKGDNNGPQNEQAEEHVKEVTPKTIDIAV